MIFDTADDSVVLAEHWLQGSGSIFVASRNPPAKSLFSTDTSGIDLDHFDDVDNSALLIRLTSVTSKPQRDTEEQVKRIAQFLGSVPLALS